MREAVHIFLKDSRQLRIPIAILLGWTMVFAWAGVPHTYPETAYTGALDYFVAGLSGYVLPFGWAYLISQAFHAEALPGDRQFWVTRPYRRRSLFEAKAMFVLAYVTLPLMLAQGWMLAWQGFPLRSFVVEILWTHLLVLAVVILPVAALSALTSTLVQFVVASAAVPLLMLAYDVQTPWGPSAWFRTSLGISGLAAVASAVVFVQFASRRTGISRLIALGGVLVVVTTVTLLPWRTAFAVQSRLDTVWNGTLSAVLLTQEPGAALGTIKPGGAPPPHVVAVRFPSLAPDTPILCEALEATFDGPDGASWHAGLTRLAGTYAFPSASLAADGCSSYVRPPERFVDRVGDRPIHVRAAIYVTVLGDRHTTRLSIGAPPTFIPGAGLCAGTKYQLQPRGDGQDNSFSRVGCQMALGVPRGLVLLSTGAGSDPRVFPTFSYSPFPSELRIHPITNSWRDFAPLDEISVVTRDPVAHARIEMDVKDVHLRDFELALPR